MSANKPASAAEADQLRLRKRAYSTFKDALKSGRLRRPDTCTKCGTNPGRGRAGQSLIQGHHHKGYDHPLEVEWLCASCHRHETPIEGLRGSAHPRARLTEADAKFIRESQAPAKEIAPLYGVSFYHVLQIRSGRTWSFLAEGSDVVPLRRPVAKVTPAQVIEIYEQPLRASASLAAEYGVSQTSIRRIRSGRSWSKVTGADLILNEGAAK